MDKIINDTTKTQKTTYRLIKFFLKILKAAKTKTPGIKHIIKLGLINKEENVAKVSAT
jgi:hypothetical protein